MALQAQGAHVLWLPSCVQQDKKSTNAFSILSLLSLLGSKQEDLACDEYKTSGKTLQDELDPTAKSNRLRETDSLLNEHGPIPADRYRRDIITTVAMEKEQLMFNPFLFNKPSELIDLKAIPKEKSKNFNEEKVIELNKEAKGSFLGQMRLSTVNPQRIPLKGLSLSDKLVLLDEESLDILDKNGITPEISYEEETRQYLIQLNKTHEATQFNPIVTLYYGMAPTKEQPRLQRPCPVKLPDDLEKAINLLSNYCLALPDTTVTKTCHNYGLL